MADTVRRQGTARECCEASAHVPPRRSGEVDYEHGDVIHAAALRCQLAQGPRGVQWLGPVAEQRAALRLVHHVPQPIGREDELRISLCEIGRVRVRVWAG